MLKFLALALAVRLLTLSTYRQGGEAMSVVSKRGNQVKLCGRMLAETLNLLCQGQYYDPEADNEIAKKDTHATGDFYPGWLLGFPTRRVSRQQRGVVDECCLQACSPSVLLSYCGSGK